MLNQKSKDLYNQWWNFKEDLDDALYVVWKLIQNKPDNWNFVSNSYNFDALENFFDTLDQFNDIALKQIELLEYISNGDADRKNYCPAPQPVYVGFDPAIHKTRVFDLSEFTDEVAF